MALQKPYKTKNHVSKRFKETKEHDSRKQSSFSVSVVSFICFKYFVSQEIVFVPQNVVKASRMPESISLNRSESNILFNQFSIIKVIKA